MANDPAQVLEVIRDVLAEHMNSDEAVPQFRVQRAMLIGKRTRRPFVLDENPMENPDALDWREVPGILRLTMLDGSQFDLTIERS
jgi:hypothetical protein